MTMRVLIVEDEAPARRRLENIIRDLEPESDIIAAVESGREAERVIRSKSPDLIFMDIELSDGSCFETLDNLQISQPVIFITAYDEYALKAFELNSVDYLIKPVSREKIRQSLEKLRRMRDSLVETKPFVFSSDLLDRSPYKRRFLVKRGQRLYPINDSEIAYFYARDKLVWLITHEQKKYVVNFALTELEDLLDPDQFFRLNRQFVANIDAIRELEKYFKGQVTVRLVPQAGEQVVVSRRQTPLLKEWLGYE